MHFMSEKNDWETPQSLFDELHAEFHFTLDAAASDQNHKLPRYYTQESDGLSQDWGGERVFCNPPYGDKETGVWTEKCWREAQKPNTLVVLLIPARTDRKSFHDFIYNRPNVEIRFLRGRLKFEDKGQAMGTAPFPSMLVIFNKEEKSMATKTAEKNPAPVDTSGMNVWAKLLKVRSEFYAEGAKKTGKNLHAEFKYFELEDIVPVAAPIFAKYGLLLVPTFVEGNAVAKVVNIDDPEETISFTIPLQFIAEPAKFRMNEVQGVGAVVTYYRRYLYMVVLDLVESDGIDNQKPKTEGDAPTPAPAAPKKGKPVTAAERDTIKNELTDADGNADELQIQALKAALKALMELDTEQENFVQEIAVKTESFTKITKAQCEALINGVKEMIAAYGEGE